jgi:hypothetical protein
MRKMTYVIIAFLLIGAALLSACASKATATQAAPAGQPGGNLQSNQYTSSQLPADYTNALPSQMQLLLGTIKLEGSADQVDAQAASVLLPLWQQAQSLSSDPTKATDLEAVLKQIEAAMTPAQIKAIAAMKLTMQDLTQYAQDNGLSMGRGGTPGANGTPDPNGNARPTPGANETPGAGGNGGPNGGRGDPNANGGTPQAPPQNGAGNGTQPAPGQNMPGFGSAFYDAVIQLLQAKK